MKASLVILAFAMRAIQSLGLALARPVTALLTSAGTDVLVGVGSASAGAVASGGGGGLGVGAVASGGGP